MIVYFGGHARNKTIGNSIFEKALPTLPAYATENGLTINYVEDVKANADLMNLVNSAWTAVA